MAKQQKKIRILYVIDKLVLAGAQRHLVQVLQSINPERYQIHLLCLVDGGAFEQTLKEHKIDYDIIGVKNWNSRQGLRGFYQLYRFMKTYQPDIVHAYLFTANFFAPLAAKLAGVPHIISSRRDLGDWMSKRQLKMTRFANHFVDTITANSEAVKQAAMQLEGLKSSDLRVIYNGIHANDFIAPTPRDQLRDKMEIPRDALLIGTVGNVRQEKDPLTLIKSFCRIASNRPDCYLIYAGYVLDQDLFTEMKAWIYQHNLTEQVIFTGSIDNIPEILKTLDIFVFSSESEGFSNALLEAMAAGLAITCSETGGNKEQITQNKTGLFFDTGDIEQCSECLETLLDPNLRETLGKNAQLEVKQRFNVKIMLKNMEQMYLGLMEESYASETTATIVSSVGGTK